MRKAMRNTIFGAALLTGLFATGAAANAQRPGFYGRGYERPFVHERFVHPVGPAYPVGPRYGFGVTFAAPVVDTYIPPCPGDGYEWIDGYYDGGIWVPGAWRLRAGFVSRPYGYERGYDRGYDRRYENHFDRHFDDRRFDDRRFEGRHFDDHHNRGFYGRR